MKVDKMLVVGGLDWGAIVNNVLDFAISNSVAVNYTYCGKAAKKAFKNKMLNSLIKSK